MTDLETSQEFNFIEAVSQFGQLLRACKERKGNDADVLLMQMADIASNVISNAEDEDTADFIDMLGVILNDALTREQKARFWKFVTGNSSKDERGVGFEAQLAAATSSVAKLKAQVPEATSTVDRLMAQIRETHTIVAQLRARMAVCQDCEFNPSLYPKLGDKAGAFANFYREHLPWVGNDIKYSMIALARNHGLNVKVSRWKLQAEAELLFSEGGKFPRTLTNGYYTKVMREFMDNRHSAFYNNFPFRLKVTAQDWELFIELIYVESATD